MDIPGEIKMSLAEADLNRLERVLQSFDEDYRSIGMTLIHEVRRLREGYLLDENGNEYVQVCILKEKINELRKENEEMRAVLEKINRICSSPEFTSVFQIAQNHHARYKGESFGEDLKRVLEIKK